MGHIPRLPPKPKEALCFLHNGGVDTTLLSFTLNGMCLANPQLLAPKNFTDMSDMQMIPL